MKKARCLLSACLAVLLFMVGCGGASEESSSSDSPAQSQAFSSSAVATEPIEGDRFINETSDMKFEIYGLTCGAGESIAINGYFREFTYMTATYRREQIFYDIVEDTQGTIRVVAAGDEASKYTLTVYDESAEEPVMEYLLIPQGLYWMRCDPNQLLYLGHLPQMPMDELLEIYPDAVLPLGHKEVDWPDGYINMLWCYEPLYNVKISSTGVLDVVDGERLYGYVDWDAAESTELMPGAPLFTDIVSVGSMWVLAVRFEDGQGNEHIYLAGENGRGGDRPGLVLTPMDGRILSQEETEEIIRQGLQEE